MDAEQSNEDAVGTSRSCHLNNNARQSCRKGRKSKRKEKKKKTDKPIAFANETSKYMNRKQT